MGLVDLGGRSYGEYQQWFNSPASQPARQADAQQVAARKAAGGADWLSSDGVIQPPWSTGGGQASSSNMAAYGGQPGGAFSAYSLGAAQPKQQQSGGTPYNPMQGGMGLGAAPTFSAQPQGQAFGARAPQMSQQPPASWGMPLHSQQAFTQFGLLPPPISQPTPATSGQFGQRNPVTRAPAPKPQGLTLDREMQRQYGDFWGQAQSMYPTMTQGQQQQMASGMKRQQEEMNRKALEDMRNNAMQQWHSEQASIGQSLANRTSSPESAAARQQAGGFQAQQPRPPAPQFPPAADFSGGQFNPAAFAAPQFPSFQFNATDFMGNQFSDPSAFTAQQGAMAQALNQQRSQQLGNMFNQGTPLPPINIPDAYRQGEQLLSGGFENPFMLPAAWRR